MKREQWKKLLKEREAFCYIKPTMKRHDSKYRCFEVGYLTLDKTRMRADKKLVLSKHSDHFWHIGDFIKGEPPLAFSMDILLDGYIRIFDKKILTWENEYEWVTSSFSLVEMKEL
jgi:hypothetical protein